MEDLIVILVLAILLGGPIWQIREGVEVRPVTMMIRIGLLLLGVVVIAAGEGPVFWTTVVSTGVGVILGVGMALLAVRRLTFLKREDVLYYQLPRRWMLAALVVLVLSLLIGFGDSGVHDLTLRLGGGCFLGFWCYMYISLLIRGQRYLVDEMRTLIG